MTKIGRVIGLLLLVAVLGGCAATESGKQSSSEPNVSGYISTGAMKKF